MFRILFRPQSIKCIQSCKATKTFEALKREWSSSNSNNKKGGTYNPLELLRESAANMKKMNESSNTGKIEIKMESQKIQTPKDESPKKATGGQEAKQTGYPESISGMSRRERYIRMSRPQGNAPRATATTDDATSKTTTGTATTQQNTTSNDKTTKSQSEAPKTPAQADKRQPPKERVAINEQVPRPKPEGPARHTLREEMIRTLRPQGAANKEAAKADQKAAPQTAPQATPQAPPAIRDSKQQVHIPQTQTQTQVQEAVQTPIELPFRVQIEGPRIIPSENKKVARTVLSSEELIEVRIPETSTPTQKVMRTASDGKGKEPVADTKRRVFPVNQRLPTPNQHLPKPNQQTQPKSPATKPTTSQYGGKPTKA